MPLSYSDPIAEDTTMEEAFPHRRNPDGSYDSICPQCFRTVSTRAKEDELREDEMRHDCQKMELGQEKRAGLNHRLWRVV